MKAFQSFIPTRLLFGNYELDKLSSQRLPGGKALVTISNGTSAKTSGALDKTLTQLKQMKIEVSLFDEIEANPLHTTVMKAAAIAREQNCDMVIAIGGGSVMDASKAIAAMATNDGDLWDYMCGGTGLGKTLANDPLPIVCITTTAGTGSEVDQYGVITNSVTKEKMGFGGDDRLFPILSIVDPTLMVSVPPHFTAYQGFDALFHSTEVFIGKFANPFSDMVCLQAISAISNALLTAVKSGDDLEARYQVALGNTLSGYAMVLACTTSEHSLEHAMSAYHQDLPHGAGLIMISIAYYEHFIKQHACDERFIMMAKAMGMTNAKQPSDFITVLKKLQKDCGVDQLKMSNYQIMPSDFKKMAINAKETMGSLFLSDPLPLSQADCIKIYEESYR